MNCALALRMLHAYLDGELDAATAAEIEDHLASCPACCYARTSSALRCARRCGPIRFASRSAGTAEIDPAHDRPPRAAGAAHRGRCAGGRRRSSAASTAVMGALGGWWLAQPRALETLPELAVAQHVASLSPAGPRIDVASSDRHVVRPWFQGRLEFAPAVRDLSAQGFDLLGARVDHLGSRQAVAIVYRLHSHIIDVYSWRTAAADAQPGREATIRGFNVIAWSDGDMSYAAVSDTDSAELARFAARVSSALRGALSALPRGAMERRPLGRRTTLPVSTAPAEALRTGTSHA